MRKFLLALMFCATAGASQAQPTYLNCSGYSLGNFGSVPWSAAAHIDTDRRRAAVDDIDLVIANESPTYFNLSGSTELSSVKGWINRIDGSLFIAFSDTAKSSITANCRTVNRLF